VTSSKLEENMIAPIMRKWLPVLALLGVATVLAIPTTHAQPLPYETYLRAAARTVHITSHGGGTGFMLNVDGDEYLVTARHVIQGYHPGDSITIEQSGVVAKLRGAPISPVSTDADVVAIPAPHIAVDAPPIEFTFGVQATWAAYFFGYPYGLMNENRGNTSALVKQGIISGVSFGDGREGLIYLDGMNNHGFSGGPVLVFSPEHEAWAITGVISSFRYYRAPVYFRRSDGGEKETRLFSKPNTGIAQAYSIGHIVHAIRMATDAPRGQ
jgi:hypothetical protein